ncbi:MAG TPA: hypothetical protein VIK41_14705 [Gemmatimonadaceae bacterium]
MPGEAPLPRSRLDPAPSLDVGAGRQRLTPTMRRTNGVRQRLTPIPRHPQLGIRSSITVAFGIAVAAERANG